MAPIIKKAYLDHPLGQIHYRYVLPTSTSKPLTPILFLHKSASSSISWEHLMSYYSAKGHACYAADMPGFGSSFNPDPNPSTPYTTTWYCELFTQAWAPLGLFEPSGPGIHLVGHHSGAALAPELENMHPAAVKSVTLIGSSVMTAAERAHMKALSMIAFNKPVEDGSHLLKTWTYLQANGTAGDLELTQREGLDHIRAWQGRMQIYGAVWEQDCMSMYMRVKAPMLVCCAKDDVLWPYFVKMKALRDDVKMEEVTGGNFSIDVDWKGVATHMDSLYASL